jgi:hypothetical protein
LSEEPPWLPAAGTILVSRSLTKKIKKAAGRAARVWATRPAVKGERGVTLTLGGTWERGYRGTSGSFSKMNFVVTVLPPDKARAPLQRLRLVFMIPFTRCQKCGKG